MFIHYRLQIIYLGATGSNPVGHAKQLKVALAAFCVFYVTAMWIWTPSNARRPQGEHPGWREPTLWGMSHPISIKNLSGLNMLFKND